jgi:hypothetical protein
MQIGGEEWPALFLETKRGYGAFATRSRAYRKRCCFFKAGCEIKV